MKRTDEGSGTKVLGRPRCHETDTAILVAVLHQLSTQGYSRMSIDAVASEANTTKPTIYRRWTSKAELAVAAIAQLQVADAPPRVGVLRDDLISALRDFQAKLLRPNGMAMIGTLLVEEAHNPALIASFRRQIVGPRRAGLAGIIAAAVTRGELGSATDIDAIVNMLVGSFYARYLTGDPLPSDWPERVVLATFQNL